MFDEVQLGWLASDDYERKAAADAAEAGELGQYDGTGLPPTVSTGRFDHDDQPEAER